MKNKFSDRVVKTKKSFIREILKVTESNDAISFAGGLPNPISFPIDEIKRASIEVLEEDGESALQYAITEGYRPLREIISKRYLEKKGLEISPDEIIITNGSQQGLDLISKVFIEKGDNILMEKPGYLGAIQAFSMYEPEINQVDLENDGLNIEKLEQELKLRKNKLIYTVPDFQNPTGTCYSETKRKEISKLLMDNDVLMIEDNPYGELRFMGEEKQNFKSYMKEKSILLGSFSKIVSPGLRLGWVCASEEIIDKVILAKQASDLHTNFFTQRIVCNYLANNDIDVHIEMIRNKYKDQRDVMVKSIEKYLPDNIEFTRPEGGMFLWIKLPRSFSAVELFEYATKEKVLFVPGNPFYVEDENVNTLRLNYTNSSTDVIEEGIKRLAVAMEKMVSNKSFS